MIRECSNISPRLATRIQLRLRTWCAEGGDPTGVGDGGVSAFDGKPFKDEIHSRLKFNHRGILAMANANEADANGSQFFLTFDSCEWLNKKHTIFGKVIDWLASVFIFYRVVTARPLSIAAPLTTCRWSGRRCSTCSG